ncbi:MAG: thiamine biosynthesis lipoprotein [Myxococcota bacterium]|jgi:thiamine biosynthesis lipoprotein
MKSTAPFIAALLVMACANTSTPSSAAGGLPAHIAVKTVSGSMLSAGAQDLKRPTLFVFWASWCKPCNREAPELVKLAGELAGQVDIIGVNVDTEPDVAEAFIAKYKLPYPSLRDADLALSDALAVKSTPTLVLVDKDGKELSRGNRLHLVKPAISRIAVGRVEPVSRRKVLMGTDVHFLVLAPQTARLESTLDAAIVEIERVEAMFSTWRPETPLSQLNARAGETVALPDEALALIEQGLDMCQKTGGKFDVTFKGAARLWDFKAPAATPPTPTAAKAAMSQVDCTRVVVDRQAGTARLPKGMALGLGGIAKGYAVDRAAKVITDAGYRNFIVNAGGDLLARGTYEGRLWQVGVRHPRKEGKNLARLPISGYAVATSGDYQRYFEHDGRRYHHILDPDTGYPATGCQSVTIIAKQAAMADALATGVFVMGPAAGLKLVNGLDGVEAMIVDAAGNLHTSSGLPRLAAR